MSQSHSISTKSDILPTPLSHIVSSPPPTILLYLLPPCLIFLAMDVALRISYRQSEDGFPLEIESHEHQPRAEEIITEHRTRYKGVIKERQQPNDRHRMLEKQRNFVHHRQRLLAYNRPATIPLILPRRDRETRKLESNRGVRPSFTAFCDRLLLQNKIWKQQREIKVLRKSLDSMSMANCSNAFKAFCDRLILSNNVWKLEKSVSQLTAETEMIKRSRVAAVTRAAKQMVLDVGKERLIEEFVKELLVDLEKSRETIKSLRAAHEREIEEMAGKWRKDYRRLSDEVDRLKLAQEARLVEQELSNTIESELIERSKLLYQKAGISLDEYYKEAHTGEYPGEDTETLSGSDLELEEMSNMSTSTYVGSAGELSPNSKSSFDGNSPRRDKLIFQQRTAKPSPLKIPPRESGSTYLRFSPVAKSPTGKLNPGPYVGFSFNPLFFGPPDMSNNNATKQVFSFKGAPRDRRSVISCSNPNSADAVQSSKPQKRVQWKVWHWLHICEPRWRSLYDCILYSQQLLTQLFKIYAPVILPRLCIPRKCI